jgi:hypothetical protein
MPLSLTYHMSQIIVDRPFFVMTTCVLNWSCGHYLFNDSIHFIIIMTLKLMEEVEIPSTQNNLMEDDSKISIELSLLISNI